MNERALREALGRAGAVDSGARDRAWRVAQAAYREREPGGRAHQRPARLVAIAAALAIVGGAAAAAALVHDVLGIGEPHARPALVRVPGGGRLLVQEGDSTWVVAPGGARRRIGSYAGASWSPHGRFVVAWRGGVLTAAQPSGHVHWSLSRPGRIRAARWSPVDGFRIAYLAAGTLRVVNGDGTGDHRYAAADVGVAPAWRPDAAHVLAYVDARHRVAVASIDANRRLWRSAPIGSPLALAWSPDAKRLLVLARDSVVAYDGDGRVVAARRLPGVRAAAWASAGDRIALTRERAGTSELLLAGRGLRGRALFSGPGRFGAPAWAPDGHSLLLPWPSAGQWLFLRARRTGRPIAVANIARQFAPGARRPPFPSAVERCCPAP